MDKSSESPIQLFVSILLSVIYRATIPVIPFYEQRKIDFFSKITQCLRNCDVEATWWSCTATMNQFLKECSLTFEEKLASVADFPVHLSNELQHQTFDKQLTVIYRDDHE